MHTLKGTTQSLDSTAHAPAVCAIALCVLHVAHCCHSDHHQPHHRICHLLVWHATLNNSCVATDTGASAAASPQAAAAAASPQAAVAAAKQSRSGAKAAAAAQKGKQQPREPREKRVWPFVKQQELHSATFEQLHKDVKQQHALQDASGGGMRHKHNAMQALQRDATVSRMCVLLLHQCKYHKVMRSTSMLLFVCGSEPLAEFIAAHGSLTEACACVLQPYRVASAAAAFLLPVHGCYSTVHAICERASPLALLLCAAAEANLLLLITKASDEEQVAAALAAVRANHMKRQRIRQAQPHSPQVFSALLKVRGGGAVRRLSLSCVVCHDTHVMCR